MTRNVGSQSQENQEAQAVQDWNTTKQYETSLSLERDRILLSAQSERYLRPFQGPHGFWILGWVSNSCQLPSVLHAHSGDPLGRGARQTAVVRLWVCLSKAKVRCQDQSHPMAGSKWSLKPIQLRPLYPQPSQAALRWVTHLDNPCVFRSVVTPVSLSHPIQPMLICYQMLHISCRTFL